MRQIAAAAIITVLATSSLAGQSFRTLSGTRQRAGEKALDVTIEFAAGRFNLHRDATGALYRSKMAYNEDKFEPISEYDDGELHLGLKSIKGVNGRFDIEKNEYQ